MFRFLDATPQLIASIILRSRGVCNAVYEFPSISLDALGEVTTKIPSTDEWELVYFDKQETKGQMVYTMQWAESQFGFEGILEYHVKDCLLVFTSYRPPL